MGFAFSTAYTILPEWTSGVTLLVVLLIIQKLSVLPRCKIISKLITFKTIQDASSAYILLSYHLQSPQSNSLFQPKCPLVILSMDCLTAINFHSTLRRALCPGKSF